MNKRKEIKNQTFILNAKVGFVLNLKKSKHCTSLEEQSVRWASGGIEVIVWCATF